MRNKYSDLRQLSGPVAVDSPQEHPTPTASEHKPAPQHCASKPKAGIIKHGPYPVESREHSRPLIATMSYITDMESDSLVRIFDKQIAPRDEAFCVAREALDGRTPEQLRDYFSLSFIPRFVCDARVPPGHEITVCSLANAAGQTAKVYFPQTYLELGNERPLG